MTVRVCCSLIAALLCLCVYLSTTDAEEAARANRSVRLAARLLSEPEKPGVCPRKNLEVAVSEVCVGSCSHDNDCPNDQKCCSNGCGLQCVDPYKAGPAKPGVCPKNNVEVAVSGVCAEMCSHDSDCPKDQKCCSSGCGHKCVAPYKEKPGVCPRRLVGEGLCKKLCASDIDCPDDQKCCRSKCGRECTSPF